MKKRTLHMNRFAGIALNKLSKHALMDLVADLVRQAQGDESIDGELLVSHVYEAFEPVAFRRGDRVPNIERLKRRARCGECAACQEAMLDADSAPACDGGRP